MARARTIAASRVRVGIVVIDSCGSPRKVTDRCELKGTDVTAGVRSEVHEYWVWLEGGMKIELKAGDRIAVPDTETTEA